jgi:hypothetical protein
MGETIMTDERRLREIIIEELESHLDPILAAVRSIRRTLRGEPEEGNLGLLHRLEIVERRVAVLLWTIPIGVTLGTGLGQLLVNWWGL